MGWSIDLSGGCAVSSHPPRLARRPWIRPAVFRRRRILELLLGDGPAVLDSLDRSGAWRAGAGAVAARTVRICGARNSGTESLLGLWEARPGTGVDQDRRVPTRNPLGGSGRERSLGTCESAQDVTDDREGDFRKRHVQALRTDPPRRAH